MKMAFHVCVISAYREFAHSSLSHQPHPWKKAKCLLELPCTCRLSRWSTVLLMKLLISTALAWRSMRFAIFICSKFTSTTALHPRYSPMTFPSIPVIGYRCVWMWWKTPNDHLNRKLISTIRYGASLRIVGPRSHPTGRRQKRFLWGFTMWTVALSNLRLYNLTQSPNKFKTETSL